MAQSKKIEKLKSIREQLFILLFQYDFYGSEVFPGQREIYIENTARELIGLSKGEALNEPLTAEEEAILEGAKKKLENILPKLGEIDKMLEKAIQGWKLSRIGKADISILRLAVYEMKYDEDIPEKVAINEAVELAKKFGGDSSPGFVNGVLAKLVENNE